MAKRQHEKGLTASQVVASRQQHGDNVLTPPEQTPLWKQFLEKFDDPLIKILLVALALSVGMAIYEYIGLDMGPSIFFEPLGIFIAIVLATLVGFLVEVNANKKFRLLNQTDDHVGVKVVRDGHVTQVPRCDIVVGDIVILETGEKVPADGTVLESFSLRVDESSFTGEPSAWKTHDAQAHVQPVVFIHRQSHRQQQCHQQDLDERIIEFLQELSPQRRLFGRREHIIAVPLAAGNHLLGGQSSIMFLFLHQFCQFSQLNSADLAATSMTTKKDLIHPPRNVSNLSCDCHPAVICLGKGRRVKRALLKIESQRSLITPHSASKKMLEFILLMPSTRLTNTMGTSLILKPMRWAVNFISIWKA